MLLPILQTSFSVLLYFNGWPHLSVCFQKHLFLHASLQHIAYTQIFVYAFEILVLICVCFNIHDFISLITILYAGSVFYHTCKHYVSVTLDNSNQKNLKEQFQEGNLYFGLWCQRVRFTVAWLNMCAQSIMETRAEVEEGGLLPHGRQRGDSTGVTGDQAYTSKVSCLK